MAIAQICRRFTRPAHPDSRLFGMLYTIAVILLILWLVGWLGFNLLGGFIHILVVLAVIAVVISLVKKV